jgi:biopolymer transport protein ExbD
MNQLKGFLKLPEDQRKNVITKGVPLDSTNKQLIDWVSASLEINPEYKLAIKGDGATNYPKVKNLFEGLRDIEYYKFWLITTQETNK